MNNKILSICIPTYNRAVMLNDLVKSILSYDGDDLEVVVVDNASTDNTLHLLEQIKDDRLVVYRNKTNIGANRNWILSLTKGTGKYLHVLNDREKIVKKNIGKYINLLRNSEYPTICNYYYKNAKPEIHSYPSAVYYCYMNSHASYFVIKKDIFDKINTNNIVLKEFSKNTISGLYPLATVAMIACKYGDYYWNKDISIVILPDEKTIKKIPTFSRNKGTTFKYTFLEPMAMKYQMKLVLRFILTYKEFNIDVMEILPYLYECCLKLATINFRYFLENKWYRDRYGYVKRYSENIYYINMDFLFSTLNTLKQLNIHTDVLMKFRLIGITLKNYRNIYRNEF